MVDWGLYRFSFSSLLLSFLSYYGFTDVAGVSPPPPFFSPFPIYGYGMVGLVWHFQYFLFIYLAG
jgi:hypothetical protein